MSAEAMAISHPSTFASGDASAVVLPPDVNSVILENLTALVGPATGALLDAMPEATDAAESPIAPKVN
jgi:hypothetical protein